MASGTEQRIAPVAESIGQGWIKDQTTEVFTGPLWCFRQPQQIPSHKAEQPLADRIGGAAVTEEAPVLAGNHQSWTPADHRFIGLAAAELEAHQQVAELAVLVGLVGIEGGDAVGHGGSGSHLQACHVTQPCRQPNPAATGAGVVHLRCRDHHTLCRCGQPLRQKLMGQVVHGQGQFDAGSISAGRGMAGVLHPCIEHEHINAGGLAVQGLGQIRHGLQIRQIGNADVGSVLQLVAEHPRPGAVAANEGEPVPGLIELFDGFQTDATGGTRHHQVFGLSHRC